MIHQRTHTIVLCQLLLFYIHTHTTTALHQIDVLSLPANRYLQVTKLFQDKWEITGNQLGSLSGTYEQHDRTILKTAAK